MATQWEAQGHHATPRTPRDILIARNTTWRVSIAIRGAVSATLRLPRWRLHAATALRDANQRARCNRKPIQWY